MSTLEHVSPRPAVPLIRPELESAREVSPGQVAAVWLLIVVGTLGAVWGGPALGDHETIVALCARNMRLTGDWIVPDFLGTPFFRKPPLPYWLVAAVSYLFPNDPATGLPVTTTAARLPMALAGLGTVLLMWHLASRMFGRRVGVVAGALGGSSLFFLLYSPNATVEMLLTFCCTWAYVHFWHAATARGHGRQFVHAMLFYIALGFAMLAKGPQPIAVVCMPLAVWWYTQRPLRVLAWCGPRGVRPAVSLFVRDLIPRTVKAFTQLWLLPGLLLFGLVFVPWMLAVAARIDHAWDLWDWQYWQRAQGNYEDTKERGPWYYLPIAAGLTVPWIFVLPEALAAPWLKSYARERRGLLYCGTWSVLAIAVMSAMSFKKPYYIAPAIPGLLLMMAVVAERFYRFRAEGNRLLRLGPQREPDATGAGRSPEGTRSGGSGLVRAAAGLAGLGGLALAAALWVAPESKAWFYVAGAAAGAGLAASTALYLSRRGWAALAALAVTAVLCFQAAWYRYVPAVDNAYKVALLDQALDEKGIPAEANVLWVDGRPDARLSFYYGRQTGYLLTPDMIVRRFLDRTRTGAKTGIAQMVRERAEELLAGSEPAYLVMEQETWEQAKLLLDHPGHLVATVDADAETRRKDWVVVSNRPR